MEAMSPLPVNFLGGSISGGEILVILVVLLLLFGANKVPSMARNLGKSLEAFRRASREVTDEIMRADLQEKDNTTPAEEPEPPAIKASPQAVNRDESTIS
jgi:sec-independent protein translocase protein TatA